MTLHLHICLPDSNNSLDRGFIFLPLDGGLRDVNFVVDDEKGVVVFQHIVIEGDSIQVLLEKRLKKVIVLLEGLLLLFNGQLIEQNLIVPLIEVLEVVVLFDLGRLEFVEVFPEVFGNLTVIDGAFVEGQNFFLLGFESPAELRRLEDLFSELRVLLEFKNGVSRVVRELLQPVGLFESEFLHLDL